ncbi:MAG: HAD family phosphatase, partial [Chitinophagaceae bacterium]
MKHKANDNSPLKAIFTDIGGVLLTDGWNRNSRSKAGSKFNLDIAEFEERHHLTFDTYEEGKLSLDDYLNRTVFYEKRNFSMDDFKKFMFDQSQPYPEMITSIARLKKQYGLKVAVIS